MRRVVWLVVLSGCSLYFGEDKATPPDAPVAVAHVCDYRDSLVNGSAHYYSSAAVEVSPTGTYVCLALDGAGLTTPTLTINWELGVAVQFENALDQPIRASQLVTLPTESNYATVEWKMPKPVTDVVLFVTQQPYIASWVYWCLDDGDDDDCD